MGTKQTVVMGVNIIKFYYVIGVNEIGEMVVFVHPNTKRPFRSRDEAELERDKLALVCHELSFSIWPMAYRSEAVGDLPENLGGFWGGPPGRIHNR